MARASIFFLLQNWLRINKGRFRYPPRLIKLSRGRARLSFKTLAPEIHFDVTAQGGTIAVECKGRCWDLLGDYDLDERRNARGFYCGLCLPGHRKYYRSRRLLWETHCFETLLQQINGFNESDCMFLFTKGGGSTWVELGSISQMKSRQREEYLAYAFPVVRSGTRGRSEMRTRFSAS